MPNILIRDLSEETKQRLAQRAKENGRSQNAEAIAILEEALAPEQKNWAQMLIDVAQKNGGYELELPKREPAREPDLWWCAE